MLRVTYFFFRRHVEDTWSDDPTIRKCIEILKLHGMIDAAKEIQSVNKNALSEALNSMLSQSEYIRN